jgi:sugar O-acyltransferase (sialic acid O-acetyltransferase NeuD family)
VAPRVNGHAVLTLSQFLNVPAGERHVAFAISDSHIRERLVNRCAEEGIQPWSVRDSSCVLMDDVSLGEGALLSPFVTITSNVKIGRYFHANLYSYVEHDCQIGDFVTFAPGVRCNGNVVVEDHAYIGAGAMIRQGSPGAPLTIGRGAVVGMGAVVTRDVAADSTVVGNPAKLLNR